MSEQGNGMAEIIRQIKDFDSETYAREKKEAEMLLNNATYADIKHMKMSQFIKVVRKATWSLQRNSSGLKTSDLARGIKSAQAKRVNRMW